MQRPNTGELLRGLRKSLAEQVLPALPKGVPHQQLKAALHLLGRLERSWDLAASHLAEDNADITAVLLEGLPQDGPESLGQRLAALDAEPDPEGYNDPCLREEARRNLMLHRVLLNVPHGTAVAALHFRMAERDSRLVGDTTAEGSRQK